MNIADKKQDRQVMRDIKLFTISFVALFLELVLIRWVSCEIRIFAYFSHFVLIAYFLGLGIGFCTYSKKAHFEVALILLVTLVFCVLAPFEILKKIGPLSITENLNAFSDFQAFQYSTYVRFPEFITHIVFGVVWVILVFAAIVFIAVACGRVIGRLMQEYRNTLRAYTINLVGSLAGSACFALMSWRWLQPWAWFSVIAVGTLPFLNVRWKKRMVFLAVVVMVLLSLFYFNNTHHVTTWSAYQKLEVLPSNLVLVNNVGYQWLQILRDTDETGTVMPDRFALPYILTLYDHIPRKVLIIGAGTGNDVAIAVRFGVPDIVAVEIDSALYRLGKERHIERPYDHKQVRVIIQDARRYLETTDEKFDLILFSHADAHKVLSGYTNLRLDNYLYTVEGLRRARELLTDDGALYLSFWSEKDWLTQRLYANLFYAGGSKPILLIAHNTHAAGGEFNDLLHFFLFRASETTRSLENDLPAWSHYTQRIIEPAAVAVPPSTDDWPFMYVQQKQIPSLILLLAGILFLMSVGLMSLYGVRYRAINGYFFWLGAAFLLLEIFDITKLALVFGTTWIVNAFVMQAIFIVSLFANLCVAKAKRLSVRACYGGLGANLLLIGVVCSMKSMVHPKTILDSLFVSVLFAAPFLFSGIIFADAFRSTTQPSKALGSYIFGALCGSLFFQLSFVYGIASLLVFAAMMYAAAFIVMIRPSRAVK